MVKDAAGTFWYEWCPNCGEIVIIYYQSFCYNGKKCTKCKFHIMPYEGRKGNSVTTYTKEKMCPICKKKLIMLDDGSRYCKFEKYHHLRGMAKPGNRFE